MEKEQYIPSLEEVKKAEEMMTIDQKHFSEYRDEMNHAKRLAEEYQKMNTPQQNLFIRKMLPPEGGYPPSEYGFSVGGINVNKENYKLFYELQEYDLDFWKMHYGDLDTTIECVRISDDGYGQDKVSFEEMLNTIGSTAILSMLGSLILRGSSSEFNGYKIWFKKITLNFTFILTDITKTFNSQITKIAPIQIGTIF